MHVDGVAQEFLEPEKNAERRIVVEFSSRKYILRTTILLVQELAQEVLVLHERVSGYMMEIEAYHRSRISIITRTKRLFEKATKTINGI